MTAILSVLQKTVDRLVGGMSCVAQFALLSMVVTICYDVIMRYVFARPTLWCLEVNTFLIVFLALVPAGDVLRQDKHFKISFFPDRLGGVGRKVQALAGNLLGALFSALMTWKGYEMALLAFRYDERMSTPLGTPLGLPYLLIPLGFGALVLQFLMNAVSELMTARVSADRENVPGEDDGLMADLPTSRN